MSKVSLNIYKRKDGRYEGRYKKGRKGRKLVYGYVYAETRKEAAARVIAMQKQYEDYEENQLEDAYTKENGPSKEELSVERWLTLWLRTIKGPEVKSSSYGAYERQIRRHIVPGLGRRKLAEIDEQAVREFAENLRRKELSESTALDICRLLRSALKEALEQGLVKKVPGRRAWPKAVKREARCLEKRERKALLKEAEKRECYEILASMYTGMRIGETAGLKWKDVDLEKGSLTVERTIQRIAVRESGEGEARTKLAVLTPKSRASKREIPIVPAFGEVLKKLWKRSRKCQEDYVFTLEKHPASPVDPRTFQRRFRAVCADAGVKGAHFHTLRHTFATICMENGFDVETLRYLLGHSSARITVDCYGHSTRIHRKEMMNRRFRVAV